VPHSQCVSFLIFFLRYSEREPGNAPASLKALEQVATTARLLSSLPRKSARQPDLAEDLLWR